MGITSDWTTNVLAPRLEHALRWAIEICGAGKLLDIGSNDGVFGAAARNAGFHVVGMDHDPRFERTAGTCVDEFVVGNVEAEWPFGPEEFDCVHMGAVLEQVYDYRFVLRECARVLKPGGAVVVSVPNMAHWKHRVQLLFGRCPEWFSPLQFEHIRPWTLTELQRVLEEAGLVIARRAGRFERHGRVYDFAASVAPGLCSILMFAAIKNPD